MRNTHYLPLSKQIMQQFNSKGQAGTSLGSIIEQGIKLLKFLIVTNLIAFVRMEAIEMIG
jgi:hypothetical protein